MSEMHLQQPKFTYRACGPFTKNKETIQKFKETRDSRYVLQKVNYINLVLNMTCLWRFQRFNSKNSFW